MQTIDKHEYQERLDRLTDLLADIVTHAHQASTRRCPYRSRLDRCTASFGCRNQRKTRKPGGLLMCGGDELLEYRNSGNL